MKNEFISTAAHELRTPLTSVLGFSELLLNQAEYGVIDPVQQKGFLTLIREKAQRLASIISDLLDLSRIQSGLVISVETAPCDMGELINRVVTPYQQGACQQHLDVTLPEEPIVLSVDQGKLEQVMENLISNAAKFSSGTSRIRISAQSVGDHFKISVADEGIGMTPEQANRVFDKFYRGDASNSAQEGLGLGMSIVKNIIEAHAGEIQVVSEPEKGTTVSFVLPLGGCRA
jgi:signal transduction histidine kinase